MKSFDWKSFLKRHPIFKSLSEDDIDQLLKDEASEERVCLKDSVIIREGEVENSVFLIGTGSIRVVLQVKDGYEIKLSVLKKENFFGEMALIEEKPRSATVIAQENSTLLEVKGKEFSKILENYSEIAFKVLLKLSERLRGNERLMAMKLKDVDEKINLFNTKLDAELKAVDAHLKASLTVFDQTKLRTDEVIKSAERSQSRLTTTTTIVGGIITIAIALFSWFGFKELQTIKATREKINDIRDGINTDINNARISIDTAKNNIESMSKEAMTARDKAVKDAKRIETINIKLSKKYGVVRVQFPKTLFKPLFDNKLEKGNYAEAFDIYNIIQELSPQESEIIFDLLFAITQKASIITSPDERVEFCLHLEEMIRNTNTPMDKILSNYILLATEILLIDEKLDRDTSREYDAFEKSKTTFSDFKEYLKALKERQRIEDKKEDLRGNLSILKSVFDNIFNEMKNKDTNKKSMYKDLNKLLEEEGMLEISNGL